MTDTPKPSTEYITEAHPENLFQVYDTDLLAVLERHLRQNALDESEKLPRWAMWS